MLWIYVISVIAKGKVPTNTVHHESIGYRSLDKVGEYVVNTLKLAHLVAPINAKICNVLERT